MQIGLVSNAAFRRSDNGYLACTDPYKGQATHCHPAEAEANLINRWFDQDQPRTVIFTDITYIPYDKGRCTAYLVIYRDGCTKEILGWAVSDTMDVQLIKDGYYMMMKNHRKEFPRDHQLYIHSDQGSQYKCVTFKQLIKMDNFIQSMSRRGNSIDNSPAETFFAGLKKDMNQTLRCKNLSQLETMFCSYISHYNSSHPHENLAYLSPKDYYL